MRRLPRAVICTTIVETLTTTSMCRHGYERITEQAIAAGNGLCCFENLAVALFDHSATAWQSSSPLISAVRSIVQNL